MSSIREASIQEMQEKCAGWAAPIVTEASKKLKPLYDRGVDNPSVSVTSSKVADAVFEFTSGEEQLLETCMSMLFEKIGDELVREYGSNATGVDMTRTLRPFTRTSELHLTIVLYT